MKKLNIGIIGSGAIGGLLGTRWAAAGHQVMFSSRNPEKLKPLAQKAGSNAHVGTVEEAAEFGEVVVLAINYGTLNQAKIQLGNRLDGKVVIDTTNPIVRTGQGGYRTIKTAGKTAGEVMADYFPKTIIVKSFTTLWSKYLEEEAFREENPLVMPVSGDDAQAKETVSELVKQTGFLPYDIGGLKDSSIQDPGSPAWNVRLTLDQFEALLVA